MGAGRAFHRVRPFYLSSQKSPHSGDKNYEADRFCLRMVLMRLFDVGEEVEAGWPVSVDVRKRRVYMLLGRTKNNHAAFARFRFGNSLATPLFNTTEPPIKEDLEDIILLRGTLAKDDKGMCLVRQRREDKKALLRIGIAPGIGGEVNYKFDSGADVVAEGVLGTDEDRFPMFVIQMSEGSFFEVTRTGDLEGLPGRFKFLWDGENLKVETE